MTTATIDTNENSQTPVLAEIFANHEEVDSVETDPLPVGDIALRGCLFERKGIGDFASSIRDGRLSDQIQRLDEREEPCFMLIEGEMRNFEELYISVPSTAMRGMVASLTVRADTPILFCSNMESLVDMTVRLSRKESSSVDEIQPGAPTTNTHTDFMTNLFMGVDGIGSKTAKKLSDEFESIDELAGSEQADFEEISGIGPSKAESLASDICE